MSARATSRRREPNRVRRDRVERDRFVVGVRPVSEALRAGRRELHRLIWRERPDRPKEGLAGILEHAQARGVPEEVLDAEAFDALLLGVDASHQGVALEAGPLPTHTLQELPQVFGDAGLLVGLDGVEDPHNLGAIARVAVAAGADGLIVPKRRSAPLSSAASRASAGALEHLRTAVVPNLREAVRRLQARGFIAVGADPGGERSLYEPFPGEGDDRESPRVLILGGESGGLGRAMRDTLDLRLRIPMASTIGSLNVSTAAAVILFEWSRRSRSPSPPTEFPSGVSSG